MRGRKPKPRELLIVTGNPGKRALPEPDPSVRPLGRAPRTLTKPEQAVWRRVNAECGLWLRFADRFMVEMFCRSWIQMVTAETGLRRALADGNGELMAAYQRIMNPARTACLKLLAEMGATTASRVRLMSVMPRPESQDPAAKYLDG